MTKTLKIKMNSKPIADQIELARKVIRDFNNGDKDIVIETDSDFFIREINTAIMNSYAKSNPENYLYNKDLLDIEGSQVRMIIDGKKRKVDKKYGIEWKEVDDIIYKLNNDQKDILFGA